MSTLSFKYDPQTISSSYFVISGESENRHVDKEKMLRMRRITIANREW
jgi:hypothetical protein